MLVLAAATQHAEGHKEQAGAAAAAPLDTEQPPHVRRHESANSDEDDYSEGQYAPQQRTAQRGSGHLESEEDKKEKRCDRGVTRPCAACPGSCYPCPACPAHWHGILQASHVQGCMSLHA